MSTPTTPGILLRRFFNYEESDFRITSKKKTLEMIFEGYEWACARSYSSAHIAAIRSDDENAKLDAIWFEAQARVFEHLLVGLNVGDDHLKRSYSNEWDWMLWGRPFKSSENTDAFSETEKALRDWQNQERDRHDELHAHFSEFGRWDWVEITGEALRVLSLMLGIKIDEYSLIDNVIAAASAQASHGAVAAVAAVLGADADALRMAIDPWMGDQDAPPAPVTAERLLELCKESANSILKM